MLCGRLVVPRRLKQSSLAFRDSLSIRFASICRTMQLSGSGLRSKRASAWRLVRSSKLFASKYSVPPCEPRRPSRNEMDASRSMPVHSSGAAASSLASSCLKSTRTQSFFSDKNHRHPPRHNSGAGEPDRSGRFQRWPADRPRANPNVAFRASKSPTIAHSTPAFVRRPECSRATTSSGRVIGLDCQ